MRRGALGALAAALALAASAAPALAAGPAWSLHSLATPTNFTPGEESGLDRYEAILANAGGEVSNGDPIVITDTLPAGLGVKGVELLVNQPGLLGLKDLAKLGACETQVAGETSAVSCEITESLPGTVEAARIYPSEEVLLVVKVEVPPTAAGPLANQVSAEGGASPAFTESVNKASHEEAGTGFQYFSAGPTDADGNAASGADSHPFAYTTSFALNTELTPPGSTFAYRPAGGDPKDIEVALPPGMLGNPTAVERCSAQQFNTIHGESVENLNTFKNECPDAAAVGLVLVQQLEGQAQISPAPLYNLIPPKGVAAQLGFEPELGLPVYINAKLRSDGDYGVSAYVRNTTEAKRISAATVTVWGAPWEGSHDRLRGGCLGGPDFSAGNCPVGGGVVRPFFRLPSSCSNSLLTVMSFDTWLHPGAFASEGLEGAAPLGCAAPDFSPTIEAQPSTSTADSPSGLHFNLHLPQEENEDPQGLGEADLRDTSVTLPAGLVANPAQAHGLEACSAGQVGLASGSGEAPIQFSLAPAQCPDASKIATVEARTPLLDHPLEGDVYLARQGENPFGSLLALYIAFEDPASGLVIKLAAKVSPDPKTGQLVTTATENPQAPVEDFTFDFAKGARAPLRTPAACGTYTTTTELVPWTAPEGPTASPQGSFQVSAGPEGPCPTGALAPKLSAGLANPTAATYSPFSLRLTRADGTGEFAGLTTITPKGLAAKLAGVPYCPEAAIAQAISRSGPGQGVLERESPSCPPASQVGTTTAGAGAGPAPFYASGKAYLAGPYKGAPLSLVAIIPAVAGPFDLGAVSVRVALHLDPETAQVSAVADPLPTILSGIPLDVRDIRANLDRPGFTLAPTSCAPSSVLASVLGTSGASATATDRFQVGGCSRLGFKPKLSLKLKGGTRRGAHPALTATVTYPKGGAYSNVARASVALPHSEFLEQAHIRTICTRVQFAANACPPGSIYGKARATSPLLDAPLEGPAYLRSSSHPLPDLVIALHGQIDANLVGRVDSHKGGIRTTFSNAPDAPVSKFTLEMQGGRKGLFVNSRNICGHPNRATAKFTAHSGKVLESRPPLRAAGCKKQG